MTTSEMIKAGIATLWLACGALSAGCTADEPTDGVAVDEIDGGQRAFSAGTPTRA